MFLEVLVYVLTALAAVVVVLTRLRLSGDGSACRPAPDQPPGAVASTPSSASSRWCVWVLFLVFPADSLLGRRGRRDRGDRPLVGHRPSPACSSWPAGCRPAASTPSPPRSTRGARARGSRCWPTSACSSACWSSPTPTSPPPYEPPPSGWHCCSAPAPRCGVALGVRRQRLVVDGRRGPPRAVVERRVIGTSVARAPDPGLATRRAGQAASRADLDDARQRAAHPPDPDQPARRPPHPRHRPVGDPDLQPRRPRPALPAQRARRRPQPQLPLRLGRPRRQLRVRPAARERARDPRGDAVPEADRPEAGAQLPPAAQRRRHRHQGLPVRASTGPRAPPAADEAGLRRALPRHDDGLVQRQVRGRGADRRVRRTPLAAPDDGRGAAPAPRACSARAAPG